MSEYAETTAKEQTTDQRARELPERIVIPPIKGEMVHLRPATIDDIARMEVIERTSAHPASPARTAWPNVAL